MKCNDEMLKLFQWFQKTVTVRMSTGVMVTLVILLRNKYFSRRAWTQLIDVFRNNLSGSGENPCTRCQEAGLNRLVVLLHLRRFLHLTNPTLSLGATAAIKTFTA